MSKAISLLAVSTLALFAFACGAAPGDESTASGADALRYSIPNCSVVPFSELVEDTGGDQGDGITKRTKPTWACVDYAGPGVNPPGGFADGQTLTSCSLATVVHPPSNLSQCTPGYRLQLINEIGYNEVFLCPSTMTLPTNTKTIEPDGTIVYEYYAPLGPVSNGCFSDPLVSGMAFVIHTEVIGGGGGNCGAVCAHF